jgi:hypothetical protein
VIADGDATRRTVEATAPALVVAARFDRHVDTIHRYVARRAGEEVALDVTAEMLRVAARCSGSPLDVGHGGRSALFASPVRRTIGSRLRSEVSDAYDAVDHRLLGRTRAVERMWWRW